MFELVQAEYDVHTASDETIFKILKSGKVVMILPPNHLLYRVDKLGGRILLFKSYFSEFKLDIYCFENDRFCVKKGE